MTDNIERLQPGDVRILTATVANSKAKGTNIKDMIIELKIYENIFSPFITAKMTVIDSLALSTLLPFVGEEMLVLEIETPSTGSTSSNQQYLSKMRRTMFFHIYKMEAQVNVTMKSKFYTLNMISVDGLRDMNTVISQKFSGKISDIAKKILETDTGLATKKELVIEETTNKAMYISNFWSPAKNLYYIAEQAMNKNNSPSYLFFENNEGFVFASLDVLLNTPILQSFYKDQKSRQGQEMPDVDSEYQRILDMSMSDSVFDYIDRKNLGAYGSTIIEYSFDVKGIRKTTLRRGDDPYSTEVSSDTSMANPASKRIEVPVHRNIYNGAPNLSPGHHSKRALMLKNLENIKTNVQVFGRMDYTAGRMVNLTMYKDQQTDAQDSDTQIIDPLYSGNYLITSLCHVITKNSHMVNMELSKASTVIPS